MKIKILNKDYSDYQDQKLKAKHIYEIARELGFTVVENYNPKTDKEPTGKVCYCDDRCYVILKVPKAIDDKK